MEDIKTPVLLVLDFTGRNFPSALYTIQQWTPYVKKSDHFSVSIGLMTSQGRDEKLNEKGDMTVHDALTTIREYCLGLHFVIWDKEVDEKLERLLEAEDISSRPTYPSFNYGSIVNKGLLLANAISSQYLTRVDPGTLPPERDFDKVFKKHVDFIDSNQRVTSRGYKGRMAVRDFFAKRSEIKNHHCLVEKMTEVPVKAQVTGGALFTSTVPGIPAIPFRETPQSGRILVWASDDGIYQRIKAAEGSAPRGGVKVPRFDRVGKPKTSFEYYRGLGGMVYLSALLDAQENRKMNDKSPSSHIDEARGKVSSFIEALKPLLDEDKCQSNDEAEFEKEHGRKLNWKLDFQRSEVAEDSFLIQIEEGLRNYTTLRDEWPKICKLIGDSQSFRRATEL